MLLSVSIQRVLLTVCEYTLDDSDSESDSDSDSQSQSQSQSSRKRPHSPVASTSGSNKFMKYGDEFSKIKKCAKCLKFFAESEPPTLKIESDKRRKEIKHICQLYAKKVRFASVHDERYRIPIYSAYQIKADSKPDSKKDSESEVWKYEPQLEKLYMPPDEMKMKSQIINDDSVEQIKAQASNKDYDNSGWERGHLFPKSYAVSIINTLS